MSTIPDNLAELVSNLVRAAMAESRARRINPNSPNYELERQLKDATDSAVDALERATVDHAVGEWARAAQAVSK